MRSEAPDSSPKMRSARFLWNRARNREREKGFEPSTSTLARLHSTTELLPQCVGAFSSGRPRPSQAVSATSVKPGSDLHGYDRVSAMAWSPRLHPDPRRSTAETSGSLALPASLERWLGDVHGPEGLAAFEVPWPYMLFSREGVGLRELDAAGQPDPYGWMVFSWGDAIGATEGGYDLFLEQNRRGRITCLPGRGRHLVAGRDSRTTRSFPVLRPAPPRIRDGLRSQRRTSSNRQCVRREVGLVRRVLAT